MATEQSVKIERKEIEQWFKELQDQICAGLEQIDGHAKFAEDIWTRPEGGGGRTRIIQKGKVFEKGGVAFSAVSGETPEKILQALNLPESKFYATGISLVIHPLNPMVPIIHMNTRYFEMESGTRWFGGGIDLTPHYVNKKDAIYFHSKLKETCDKHNPSYYPDFRKWADDYFYIPHRKETRGIGGIFFDRLVESKDTGLAALFEFVKDVGKTFLPTYTEIVLNNKDKDFGIEEKKWQSLRRGRYVEFNLVYDKGTKFGLDTNGRTESILMSLPPIAEWEYNYQPLKGSKEEETISMLKKNINWI